jgi:hypothetical protein
MPSEADREPKRAAEALGEMMRKFGNSVGEILEDPKVKESAKEFASVVADAAARVAEKKIKAEEVRRKFRNVGKAAQTLGSSVEAHFQS